MVRPINILQSIPAYSYTGPETLVRNIFEKIDRERFHLDFIVQTQDPNPDLEYYQANGSTVYRITSSPKQKTYRYVREVAATFAGFDVNYDILHSHVPLYGTLFAFQAMRHGVKTRIAHSHATQVDGIKQQIKLGLVLPVHNRIHTHFAACSREAADFFFGARPDVYIMRNAFDLSRFKFSPTERRSAREEFGLSDKLVIGHMGRFAPPKNHSFLIAVFHEILRKFPDAVLLSLGDGPLLEKASGLVDELGMRNQVIFAGRRHDVPRLLCAMDLFIFPSKWEALPYAPLEAQANGLPCLVSSSVTQDIRCNPSVKFLDLRDSASAWADAALQMRELRTTDGFIKGPLQKFDINRTVRELERYYTKVTP